MKVTVKFIIVGALGTIVTKKLVEWEIFGRIRKHPTKIEFAGIARRLQL